MLHASVRGRGVVHSRSHEITGSPAARNPAVLLGASIILSSVWPRRDLVVVCRGGRTVRKRMPRARSHFVCMTGANERALRLTLDA